jgi:hypothetical protein
MSKVCKIGSSDHLIQQPGLTGKTSSTLRRAATNRTARHSCFMQDGITPRGRACIHRRRRIPAGAGEDALVRPEKRRRVQSPPVTGSLLTPPVTTQMPNRVSMMMLPPPALRRHHDSVQPVSDGLKAAPAFPVLTPPTQRKTVSIRPEPEYGGGTSAVPDRQLGGDENVAACFLQQPGTTPSRDLQIDNGGDTEEVEMNHRGW